MRKKSIKIFSFWLEDKIKKHNVWGNKVRGKGKAENAMTKTRSALLWEKQRGEGAHLKVIVQISPSLQEKETLHPLKDIPLNTALIKLPKETLYGQASGGHTLEETSRTSRHIGWYPPLDLPQRQELIHYWHNFRYSNHLLCSTFAKVVQT